jgi:uridine kinase
MVIGICGGSGSGKTTLLKKLMAHYAPIKPTAFVMDNYYKPIHLQEKDHNQEVNFDLPTALDRERLFNDFESLLAGKSVRIKEYQFNNSTEPTYITLEPSPIIIIEGLFLLHYEEIRAKLDFSIFVELDLHLQLERRLLRDNATRGYSENAIRYQWDNHVIPSYNHYLLPYKNHADFVFLNEHTMDVEFEKLINQLNQSPKIKDLVEIH